MKVGNGSGNFSVINSEKKLKSVSVIRHSVIHEFGLPEIYGRGSGISVAETLSLSLSFSPWPRERGWGQRVPCLVGCLLCREILEGFRKTGDPFAPAPFPRPELGAGVLRKFAQSFGAQIFAQILVQIFHLYIYIHTYIFDVLAL